MTLRSCCGWCAVVLGAVAVLGLVGGQTIAGPQHEHATIEIGKPAPDFTLKDTEGKSHTLSSLKGKIVVLQWTNNECPFIVRHEKTKKTPQNTYNQFKDKNVVWFGINSTHTAQDNIDTIKSWIKENQISYPILIDADGKVGHLFGAKTTPHCFVIDQQGNIAYMGAIDNDPSGKNPNATNYVAEAITALQSGSTVATTTTEPYGCSVKYKD